MAGFNASNVEEIPDEAIETTCGFLNFRKHGLFERIFCRSRAFAEVAGGSGDSGDRRPDFVRNGVEQCPAESFGFGRQISLLFRVTKTLTVQDQGDLADESIEQIALVGCQ